ncbi:MAG: DUF1232 domain-containing protein [Bacteroidetes bacterium]|jgi:uncharacterized membrane protein YkvA (DUF1232 family)|nr:DUF1232 domain-containing protein [Bacteroidota bacterium]MBT5529247.1 DUF1232 domain-containing protein [Cytophagia bacterium]MBT3799776.1 DUF1232 domain-containing protein [Bacteroidota bacterium]MBT3935911.1 DUF1232 domain-containing protein [Bacteroidota bacterium]MBT4339625.1 DUF1232 domain-containing protein [Bacteroidota bacterium]
MAEQENDFVDRLQIRINYWLENKGHESEFARHLKWTPQLFEFMCKLSLEKEVQIADKANLAVAISYFLSPFDLFPEALAGTMGYADDIVLAAVVLNYAFTNLDDSIVQKHWQHTDDIKAITNAIVEDGSKMVGKEMHAKLIDLVRF